ncbi:cyclic nucleotide-binding domain-containing protein [Okeania sp. SIO1I7]|uniref:cyclic nucleotide-binding domain-containing protein n=1 Tax=Okeania sp. SIO1I7 TaxID=2607772 RepID=UPI0013FC31BF|nr:cyclic nucleotide-binding domain-containing protein [Okeania sp. SIO1I7]NET25159.1 cyclic nucleotide-binding domain-containing protein [Okeania sp. SIO1I7]
MSKVLAILGELSNRDIDWMIANGSKEKITTNTILIHEGQPIDALYIVLDGTMKAYVAGVGNQEIGIITSGEILGEMSFVDGRLPSATVKAIENTLILSISKQKLNEKLEQDVLFSLRFYRAITKFLSTRLRGTVTRFSEHKDLLYQDNYGNNNNNTETLAENSAVAKSRFEALMERLKSS